LSVPDFVLDVRSDLRWSDSRSFYEVARHTETFFSNQGEQVSPNRGSTFSHAANESQGLRQG